MTTSANIAKITGMHEKTFPKRSYLEPQLKLSDTLIINDVAYVHRTYNPTNNKYSQKQKYAAKKKRLEAITIEELLVHLANNNKNVFELITTDQLKLPIPQQYPLALKGKKISISRLNIAYRLGGHLDMSQRTFYLFWVDLAKCDIYDHK